MRDVERLFWKCLFKNLLNSTNGHVQNSIFVIRKNSTVPRSLLVLSYVFQSLSLVYLPNGPHLVQVLGLTTKIFRQISSLFKSNIECNKLSAHKQDTWATCSSISNCKFFKSLHLKDIENWRNQDQVHTQSCIV